MAQRTILFEQHIEDQARMVDFAGWEMPIQYTSITAEHMAVRQSAGIFDVSHMGRFFVECKGAADALERILPSRIANLGQGKVRYSMVCNEKGGIEDDILVTRFDEDRFFIVVNASNVEKLLIWFDYHLGEGAALANRSHDLGMAAIQGPKAERIVSEIVEEDVSGIGYYNAVERGGMIVSRTGYTGEDGFEIIAPNEKMAGIWKAARAAGAEAAGLGARDTLRLEAGYPLYGHELNDQTTPLESGLTWAIDLDKEEFVGREAILRQQEQGIPHRRIGFVLDGAGVPRQGCRLLDGEKPIGEATSGGFSPILKKGFGLALVQADHANPKTLSVEIRNKNIPAHKQKPPFVKLGVKK